MRKIIKVECTVAFTKVKSFILLMAIALTGCGGGGDDDSDSPATFDNIQLQGTASKGIINGGIVTAQELDASANVIATVGSAVTDSNGGYTLELNDSYNGGPIQVTISIDANTQMKCDVPAGCGDRTDDIPDDNTSIEFGEWYKPSGLTMTALVPDAAANEEISVNVTPYTHMAAERAKAEESLNAVAVASANSEVSNLLGGIDILHTAPVDITDSDAVDDAGSQTQVTYAALASAIASEASADSNGQPELDTVIALLVTSFDSGVIQANDDGAGDDAAQISLQEIVAGANETFDQIGINDVTDTLSELQSDIDAVEPGGSIDPEPSDTVGNSVLDNAKAMVADVRTWGTVIETEAGDRAEIFGDQIELAGNAMDFFGTDALDAALAASLDVMLLFNSNETNLANYDLGVDSFTSGSITSTSPGVITITDGVVHGYTVDMTVTAPADGSSASEFSLAIVATLGSDENTLTITNGTATVTLAETYTFDYAAIYGGTEVALPEITDLTFDLEQVSFTQKVDSLGAALASPVSFSGSLEFDLDAITVANAPTETEFLPATLQLSGTISNTQGDSFTGTFVVNITNTDTFQYVEDMYGDFVEETTTNWIDADIGLTFVAQLSGLPEARFNISADRTDFEAGNGNLTISYGSRSIAIDVSANESSTSGTLTITNQDNIVLQFTNNDHEPVTGTLSFNSVQYATISETASGLVKVSYIDGTFETF